MSGSERKFRPCVGITLFNKDGLVFAAQRIDTPGAWQMPQGGIDKGEEPIAAGIRELEEETGIRPDRVTFLGQTPDWLSYELPEHLLGNVWKGKYRGQKQLWYAYQFLGEDSEINIETEHPEFSAWQWMELEKLPDLIVPFKRDVYLAVAQQFRKYADLRQY